MGEAEGRVPPPPQKTSGKYFSGNSRVNSDIFGEISCNVNFSGKCNKNSGILIIFGRYFLADIRQNLVIS